MIPLVDLKAQYQSIREEINVAIDEVLVNTQFIGGPAISSLEAEFAEFCNTKYAVGTASGTAALHIALWSSGIGQGDEVITTPFTFISTVETILRVGARPVLVDIDPLSFNINPDQIKSAITSDTKAIIPVHLYGHPVDMDSILEIAREHDLTVIEDAAQAHGAEYKSQRVGGIGDVGCFSFYPAKNLGAYGDAGILTTNSEQVASRARQMRDHGREDKYTHEFLGQAERMDTIQAAILRVKLRHLEDWTEMRQAAARRYDILLQNLPVTLPLASPDVRHVYHLYVIRVPDRTRVLAQLNESGIGAGVHYPIPLHLQPALTDLGYKPGDLPESERAAEDILSLPLYPELTDDQASDVAAALSAALESVGARS